MIKYLENLLRAMRPAFSRKATFVWFVLVFAGFVTRTDTYGVSSIIRALWLGPVYYHGLLHFFHSTAWTAESLMAMWRKFLIKQKVAYMVSDKIVLVGDHTKVVKDARKMPEVKTMHQDSETGSKPSFFRGHHWACISLLLKAANKYFGAPMWAEIHRESLGESRTTRIVNAAGKIVQSNGRAAYLILDAYFAVGPVFLTASKYAGDLPILTRAKKNVVAYLDPPPPDPSKRGPKNKYGEKLKLMKLFDTCPDKFETTQALIYDKLENVRHLTMDLIWKPVKSKLRFILVESSRGRIILMTSDMTMDLQLALSLYCRRVTVETLFDYLKNLLGGMSYHFWSRHLKPVSRKPLKNKQEIPLSTRPDKTKNTLAAIEKFVAVQMVVLGALQLLAYRFGNKIHSEARCWLRTPCGPTPSVFVAKTALANIIRNNLMRFRKDWITQIIIQKQDALDKDTEKYEYLDKVA